MASTTVVSEITLPREVILDAAAALLEWDARVRHFAGAEDLADGPGEPAIALITAAVKSADPGFVEDLSLHPIFDDAWRRAEERFGGEL